METSLSVADKEKIIELKVKEYEAERDRLPINQRRYCFSVTGPAFMRLIRDSWASDMPYYALQQLCIEGLVQTDSDGKEVSRMTLQTAIDLATGKKMLIGDSRLDTLPGAIEIVDDDGRFKDEYETYSLEEMVERIERYYVKDANYRSGLVRILNLLKDELEPDRDDDPIMITDKPQDTWLSPFEIRQKVQYLDKQVKKHLNELDFLYPLIKKRLIDLPQIGTEPSAIESKLASEMQYRRIQQGVRAKSLEKIDEDKRKRQDELDEKKRLQDIEDHRNLITPIKDEELSEVGSCWLLPDGTMFGGTAYAYIHNHIIYYLNETGYFKIKTDEKDVEKLGWCKLSGGHGFMLYNHQGRDVSVYTEAQRLKIIDWMIAHNVSSVRINDYKIPIQHLMEMTAEDMDSYNCWMKSDRNLNPELNSDNAEVGNTCSNGNED